MFEQVGPALLTQVAVGADREPNRCRSDGKTAMAPSDPIGPVDPAGAPGGAGTDSDADRTGMAAQLLSALAAHPDEMAHLVEFLSRRVTDHETLLDLMHLVASEAVRLIPDARWAGVTVQFEIGRAHV